MARCWSFRNVATNSFKIINDSKKLKIEILMGRIQKDSQFSRSIKGLLWKSSNIWRYMNPVRRNWKDLLAKVQKQIFTNPQACLFIKTANYFEIQTRFPAILLKTVKGSARKRFHNPKEFLKRFFTRFHQAEFECSNAKQRKRLKTLSIRMKSLQKARWTGCIIELWQKGIREWYELESDDSSIFIYYHSTYQKRFILFWSLLKVVFFDRFFGFLSIILNQFVSSCLLLIFSLLFIPLGVLANFLLL